MKAPVGIAGRGVAALRKAGTISDVEVLAAERWYQDYAFGAHGAVDRDPGRPQSPHKGDAHTAGFARARAINAFSDACDAVGRAGKGLLGWLVMDQVSFSELAGCLGIDRKAAVGAAVMVLRRLAEHYADTAPIGQPSVIRRADFSA